MKEEFFYDSVMSCIREHQLVGPDDKILVALSGGADSVALLLVLQQAGFHCEAVHCNFHLRGEESDVMRNSCAIYAVHGPYVCIRKISTRRRTPVKKVSA